MYSRAGVSALCENRDALAHAHQDVLGKDENKFTRHFKAVIPEGYISVSVNFINLAVFQLHHRSRACQIPRNVLTTSANDACPTTCKDVSLLAFLAFQPSLSLAPASHEAHANEASYPIVEVPSTFVFPNPV
jgi:hypothetical protein